MRARPRRPRRTLAVIAALTLGLATLGAATTARADDFYQPPATLPPDPGDVIRTAPMEAWNTGRLGQIPATATRLMYRSTDALGDANAITGTLLVPKRPWTGDGPRPIVGYAIGTHGFGDPCAPSRQLANGTDYEATAMAAYVAKGYAVMITDYEGLGTPGDHTYMVGRSQGAAVLDALRAATRVSGTGLSDAAPMVITGYSQGGSAAAWAAEMHGTYAPELPLKAVAAGGVPADLGNVARNLDGGPFFAFLAGAALGLKTAYPELPFEEHLSEQGKRLLEDGRDACMAEGLSKFAFKRMSGLTTADLINMPAWQRRISEQELGHTAPKVPVLVYHGLFDEIIPFKNGKNLRNDWCTGGARVTWTTYPIAEHLTGMIEALPATQLWLDRRLAGQPQRDDC